MEISVVAQGIQWKLYSTMKSVMQGERKSHRTIYVLYMQGRFRFQLIFTDHFCFWISFKSLLH